MTTAVAVSSNGKAPGARVRADFDSWRVAADRHLTRRLARLPNVPPVLADALRYSVLGGGKRLRPQFVLLGATVVGGRVQDALPVAAWHAVEPVDVEEVDELLVVDELLLALGQPLGHLLGQRLLPRHVLGAAAEQAAGVEGGPLVGLDLLADGQALAEQRFGPNADLPNAQLISFGTYQLLWDLVKAEL